MTTPVGDIRLDLKIDGSGLSAELVQKILGAMAPALGDLQRRLNAVERDYQGLTREAEKSATKQSGAANLAGRAVKDIGDEHTKTAAKAQAAAGMSTRSLNAQTRAVLKQKVAVEGLADAWAKAAAAQTAAAAAPTPSGPSGGGGGGGGRGGGGGGRGGRFTSGWTGAGVFNLGALGLGSFPAAATVVTNLTGAIQQLVQVGLLAPGVMAGIAASVGTAAIGFQGMGDAITALNEAAKSGDPKDLEKAAEALKHMDVNAVNTAKAISKFTQGPWKDLQKQTAHNMFEGIDQTFTDLTDKTMPSLSRGTAQVASSWNKTFKELGRVGGLDSTTSFLDKIFGNTAEAQNRANAAIDPLVHGLGTLTSEGTDFLPRLADGLAKVTGRFDDWITKSAANGNLDKWIDQGITGVGQLGETLLNVGKIITSITQAAGGDGGLLAALEGGSTKLAEFLASAEGQEKLTNFFREGREQIAKWISVLQEVWAGFLKVYDAAKQWTSFLLPVLSEILGVINALPGGIEAVVLGFLAFKTLSPFAGLLGGIKSVDTALGSKGGGGILGKLGTVGAIVGGGTAISGIMDQAENGASWGGAAATIGGATVAGASVGGPFGAAAGALIGAASEMVLIIKQGMDDANTRASEKLDQWRADPRNQAAVDDANRVTGRDVVLQPSLKTPNALPDLASKIQAGQIPGYTLNPDGSITAPGGNTINIPGMAPGQMPPLLPPSSINPPLGPSLPTSPQQPLPVVITNPTTLPGTEPLLPKTAAPTVAPTDLSGLIGGGGVAPAQEAVDKIATSIQALPTGEVEIKDASPEVIKNLETLDVKIEQLPEGKVKITANTDEAKLKLDNLIRDYQSKIIRLQVQFPAAPGALPPGRAGGGILPGYSPGVDNMLVPMSGGEGVVIPEAMRALGAGWLYGVNSQFRSGLSRRGYAGGGVVGFDAGGVVPAGMSPMAADIAAAMAPVVDLLTQILTTLGGKAAGDLATQIGDSTATALTGNALTGGTGTAGMTSTEAKIAQQLAAGKLDLRFPHERAADDLAIANERRALGPGGSALGGDLGRYASALTAFASSGSVSDITGLGLDANDPVVKAITTARNKKKNALGSDAIAGLIDQVLVGGGYTGTLDSTNTSLITALQTYREKLAKGTTGAGSLAGGAPSSAGLPMPASGDAAGLIGFAQRASGGQYEWGASDLAAGLSDCSGAVSDLVEIISKGQAGPERLFSTDTAADVLTKLGAVPGLVPGALQIGFNSGHMASTLPNGVNFESGGGTGQGATYGGNALGAGDPRFTQQFSLPVGGLAGMVGSDPFQSMASNMCGCVGDTVGGLSMFGANAGPGQSPEMQALTSALTSSVNAVLPQVMSDAMNAVMGVGDRKLPDDVMSGTDLVNQRNPAVLAALAGIKVGDYNRTGGQGQADNLTENEGPAFDQRGAIMADTAALIDRTMTSMETAAKARHQQLMDVMSQVRDQLVQISSQLAQAAIQAAGKATGGAIYGGKPGRDSVPAMLMPGEHVLTTSDVARMGGQSSVYRFRSALAAGQVRGFATGGGVIANETVGAEFFGVSQIPIIGTIVNILIRIFLAVLGVQIEARDTLDEMSDEFRQFRGEFKAFDASGRIMNDTSALVDRSATSEETAAEERVRILTQVLEALIKYIIEKVIVPMAKAVANSLLQAAGSAVSTALSGASFGMGGQIGGAALSSLITGVGGVGVDVIAEIASSIGVNLASVLLDVVAGGLQSILPNLMVSIFGGGLLQNLLMAPLQALLMPITAIFGGLSAAAGGLFAPLLAGLGGLALFDSGGIASGMGFMPKAVIAPERVLSPRQTVSFEQLPASMDRLIRTLEQWGSIGSDGAHSATFGDVTIMVPGQDAGREVVDALGELIPYGI